MLNYFDWAATSLINDQALEEYNTYSKKFYFNCSAIYNEGIACKKELNSLREKCAKLLKVNSEYLFWTSGATESNNIVLSSFLTKKQKKKILYLPIEHPSVLNPIKKLKSVGFDTVALKIDKYGFVDIDSFKKELDINTQLVTIMCVNNETGVIQNIKELSEIIKEFSMKNSVDIWFHSDVVQAVGKIDNNIFEYVTSASISAHKFCGPKGCGILFCKKSLEPVYGGGNQENGVRSGTENLPAIAATVKALELACQKNDNLYFQKNYLIDSLAKIKGINFIPNNIELLKSKNFSPFILQLSIPKIPSEVIVRLLNENSILISNGSACSSNSKKESKYVLDAINIDKIIQTSSVRVSFYKTTTLQEIDNLINAIKIVIDKNKFLVKG